MFQQKITLFGRQWQLFIRGNKEQKSLMYGVGNRCENGEYILFLDYDETPMEWIIEEIRLLQSRYSYELGTAYLFTTKHGHHVVFLERHPLGKIIEMLDMTSCDKHYKNIPMNYGRKLWVLRQSPKLDEHMKYLGRLTNYHREDYDIDQTEYPKGFPLLSSAHKKYFQELFNIPDKEFPKETYDNDDKLTMAYYRIHEEKQ